MTLNYKQMPPDARFGELDRMAQEFFEVSTWRIKFARRYDMNSKQLSVWARPGRPHVPIWALVSMSDALDAKRMRQVRDLIIQTK